MTSIKGGYTVFIGCECKDLIEFGSDEDVVCYDKNGFKLSQDEIVELFAKYDRAIDIEPH
jgi:hypothetical protein